MVVRLDEQEIERLQQVIALVGSISVGCSVVILVSHLCFKQLRSRSANLVFHLTLSVLGADITALSFLAGGSCAAYGLLTSFFIIVIALWSAAIARTISIVVHRGALHRSLTRLNSIAEEHRFRCKDLGALRMAAFHIAVWGIGVICATAIVIISAEEPISSWCWFQSASTADAGASTGQLLFFYTPLALAFCYNLVVLLAAHAKHIWHLMSCLSCGCICCNDKMGQDHELALQSEHQAGVEAEGLSEELQRLVASLRAYVFYVEFVVLFLCLAEAANFAVVAGISDDESSGSGKGSSSQTSKFWVYLLISLLLRFQGVFNLGVYAMRQEVRLAWNGALIDGVLGLNRCSFSRGAVATGDYYERNGEDYHYDTPASTGTGDTRDDIPFWLQTPQTVHSSTTNTPFSLR